MECIFNVSITFTTLTVVSIFSTFVIRFVFSWMFSMKVNREKLDWKRKYLNGNINIYIGNEIYEYRYTPDVRRVI